MFRKPITLLHRFEMLQSARAVHSWREITNDERHRWNTAGRVCDNVRRLSDSKYRGKGNRALRRQGIVRCRECEETDVLDGEMEIHAGLCNRCSEDYEFCTVCNTSHHKEHMCEHIFWYGEGGWWDGCGSDTHSDFDHIEKPFHAFLDFFARRDETVFEFADGLERALTSHRYEFWQHGYMFEMPKLGCKLNDESRDWGDGVFDEFSEEEHEEFYLGGSWLLTLEQGKTYAADLLTLSWLQSWRTQNVLKVPEATKTDE